MEISLSGKVAVITGGSSDESVSESDNRPRNRGSFEGAFSSLNIIENS